jgi:hypothetical protein
VPDINASKPHIARIYDFWLGGKDNFAADRLAAKLAIVASPTVLPGVRANRRFLGRVMRCMPAAGIRQFLDVGTGIPTADKITGEQTPTRHRTKPHYLSRRSPLLRESRPVALRRIPAKAASTTRDIGLQRGNQFA